MRNATDVRLLSANTLEIVVSPAHRIEVWVLSPCTNPNHDGNEDTGMRFWWSLVDPDLVHLVVREFAAAIANATAYDRFEGMAMLGRLLGLTHAPTECQRCAGSEVMP